MRYKSRVERLETYHKKRQPPSHCIPVAFYPDPMTDAELERWHREKVTCSCGKKACPELRIAVLLPEKEPMP